jgi:hypothetical protein
VALQAAHVAAASRLLPSVCAAPARVAPGTAAAAAAAAAGGTFQSLNADKFRAAMAVLDWPFAVVWPPAPTELSLGTTDGAACRAVALWVQVGPAAAKFESKPECECVAPRLASVRKCEAARCLSLLPRRVCAMVH